MAQATYLRKATAVKKMNDRSLLLSINEITPYFKKMDSTGGGVWKKNLFFVIKSDASNGSS